MGLEKECCPRRRWGKTELSIPVTPFGTQGFGGHFGPVNDEEAMALMRRAVDLGVNHFDCARCYGDSLHKLGSSDQGRRHRPQRDHHQRARMLPQCRRVGRLRRGAARLLGGAGLGRC